MIIDEFINKAKKLKKKIVFPEATDTRILEAALRLDKEGIVHPILIGDRVEIDKIAAKVGLNVYHIQVLDPKHDVHTEKFAKKFYTIRKKKGMTLVDAKKHMLEPIYFGTMLVNEGLADGLVSGATHPTTHTLIPALQIIKTRPDLKIASSFFFMVHPHRTLMFADCGFVVNPSAEELAEIAIETAESAKFFGMTPKVAMLSFSTKGSAKHPDVDKVVKATKIAKKKRPDLIIDGEMQADAALVPDVCKKKCPDCGLKGDANILIFPDLDAGNIAYKLVQRLAGDEAIGPIVQGLNKPVNDLSRGCTVEDIIGVAAITAIQAK
ncbi:MAG: phosphate acetyltransferase [archaeon]